MKSTISEINGRWTCSACGREWSAMLGDNEVPEICDCQSNTVNKPAVKKNPATQTDLVNIAEFLKFIRMEAPNIELDVLELLDVSESKWDETLERLNNSVKN